MCQDFSSNYGILECFYYFGMLVPLYGWIVDVFIPHFAVVVVPPVFSLLYHYVFFANHSQIEIFRGS